VLGKNLESDKNREICNQWKKKKMVKVGWSFLADPTSGSRKSNLQNKKIGNSSRVGNFYDRLRLPNVVDDG